MEQRPGVFERRWRSALGLHSEGMRDRREADDVLSCRQLAEVYIGARGRALDDGASLARAGVELVRIALDRGLRRGAAAIPFIRNREPDGIARDERLFTRAERDTLRLPVG
jgi:hypothetical protein